MENKYYKDWGEVSDVFDIIQSYSYNKNILSQNEAQTRFDIIDRIIKEILQWEHGQIQVEEYDKGSKVGYVDYILRSGDNVIIVEAKKSGASFPSPTKKKKLKLTGPLLRSGEINDALIQAEEYAKNKKANLVVVTNGLCWCFYPYYEGMDRGNTYANLIFPLESDSDAEELFNYLSCHKVENNSLVELAQEQPYIEVNSLLSVVQDSDARIDRNTIADHLAPALDHALHSESILDDVEKLKVCFVATEGRTKFDSRLNMHLVDHKPITVQPAKRIRKQKGNKQLESLVSSKKSVSSPPVTLIIGSVGSGKTTYLKHFELLKGNELISKQECHWIYIDFEKMGIGGNPRDFIFENLKLYLLLEKPHNPTDYNNTIEPAYGEEIRNLRRGPFAKISNDKFDEMVASIIKNDYDKVEPYVNKIFSYLSTQKLCVFVMDNIDLYEDDLLETKVFSEAISIAKNIKANILVSIRDTTFVKHRNDSIFNAHELKKLWLDPPPFKEVLSKRLQLSRRILESKKAEVIMANDIKLLVDDLGVFFDIAKSSLLTERNGKFLESLANKNIRTGINLVRNFLTSGHIQADKAIKNYLYGDASFKFPYHEVFKGCTLGQWKYFKEERSEVINIYNSSLSTKSFLLLRLHVLKYLYINSKDEKSVETPVDDIIDLFSNIGASKNVIIAVLNDLRKSNLISDKSATIIQVDSIVFLTLTGGYYISILSQKFVYCEAILLDTPIYDKGAWDSLTALTQAIESERNLVARMTMRKERIMLFLNYLKLQEEESIKLLHGKSYLGHLDETIKTVGLISDNAIRQTKRRYSNRPSH